jgi:hypothetical protein
MIHCGKALTLGVFVLAVGASWPVWAQEAITDAQNKLLARRAAEADCYRKLAEAVYGVQVNSETFVRDFITESDEIRTAVDAFVRGVRLGPPTYYEDGSCEVNAEVTVAKLITNLKAVHSTHYHGNRITTTDIENIKQYVKTDVIRVTGSGAPRPDLPPDLPYGVEDVVTPLPTGYMPPPRVIPPLWKTVGAQGRLMAERAAEVDAMRKLLESILGLRLTSETLVRDFITESDEIRTRANGIVVGATVVRKYLHSDELIAEVTMEVPVERVITRIKELHSQHYHGNQVTTTDIMNIKKSIQRDVVRATGSGVPPARFAKAVISAGVEMPTWFEERIRATGEGTDPAIDTAQGKLKARRAARMDAIRRLAEQVEGLRIDANTLVRDFVTEYDEIRTSVDAVITGAVEEDVEFTGDTYRVTVSIPAAEIWSVVHQQMLIVQRRG